jgi:hypothetical protein
VLSGIEYCAAQEALRDIPEVWRQVTHPKHLKPLLTQAVVQADDP